MKINRIRKLEGVNLGDQLEKLGIRLALISGIIGILALIFNLSFDMRDIQSDIQFLSDALSYILYYGSIILMASFLISAALLLFGFVIIFLYRIIPYFWMLFKFQKYWKKRIDYQDLYEKAIEIRKKIPWYIFKSQDFHMESIFTYTGIAITINTSIFRDDDELLLCKTTNEHGSYQIQGSNFVEVETEEYPDISRYYDFWEFILKDLIADKWEKTTLKSEWQSGYKIIKHCIRKDEFLLIYDIDKIENMDI